MSTDHPSWKCGEDTICKVCKKSDHITGSAECEFYITNNGAYTFGGRNDPLGLSNFAECSFSFKGQYYPNREVAFQHQSALSCDQPILADEILKAETPSEAKYLSRCLIKHGRWNSESSSLMTNICLAAATDNNTYKTNILKTKDRYLAESINGNYFWSTGLSHKVTKQTNLNMFPGDNEMGKILMGVRETLRKQEEDFEIVKENISEEDQQTIKPIEEQDTFEQTAASPELSPQKPPLSEKPNFKRKPSSTPPNARDEKKLAIYKTPTSSLNKDDETVFSDSSISPTQFDPLRTSHLLSGNEDENQTY